MSTEFPEISQLIGNDITEGDFKVAISQFLDATRERFETIGDGRSCGEIVNSAIPLTDAGLHLMDGSLLEYGGMYTKFVQRMIDLRPTIPELVCTQSEFDASVDKYGVCSKFVVSDSSVRLPKLYSETRYLVKAWRSSTGDKWYNLYSDGWIEQGETNIILSPSDIYSFEKEFRDTSYSLNTTPVLGGQNTASNGLTVNYSHSYFSTSNKTTTGFKIGGNANVTFPKDIYACGYAKETPDQEKIYRYICVATSVKTPVEVDIDEIATDLNNKADRDFGNVTKPYIVEMGENSAGWWKILSNGWVEQGGVFTRTPASGDFNQVVQFNVEFSSTDYTFIATGISNRGICTENQKDFSRSSIATTVSVHGDYGVTSSSTSHAGFSWEAKGWKA